MCINFYFSLLELPNAGDSSVFRISLKYNKRLLPQSYLYSEQ